MEKVYDHVKAQLDYPEDMREDFTVDQKWEDYGEEEHGMWKALYQRQEKILPGRVCQEFFDGLETLDISLGAGIPNFERLSDRLEKLTGWRIVAVPGLIPDNVFFEHLASRRFPVTRWIRKPEEMDYLQEPDVFHDLFGHVPLLSNPVFADYMEAYGKGGIRALKLNAIKQLARLYWYTVEFGLIETQDGLRIYGAGIVSSKGESVFALEDSSPNRIGFNLKRLMHTEYRIDDYQETYFVIKSFEQLFEETYQDFANLYEETLNTPILEPRAVLESDHVIHQGNHTYFEERKAG